MSVKLALQRFRGANYARMMGFAREDATAAGRAVPFIIADMLWCALRYGAAFTDYHTLRFYGRRSRDRRRFITMGVNVRTVKRCNNIEYLPLFEDKLRFNNAYGAYLKRRWINLRESDAAAFAEWLSDQEAIFAKRTFSNDGRDVARFEVHDYADAETLYNELISQKYDLAEEAVIQHPYMSGIYPRSVNTLRLMTMLKDGKAHLIFSMLRFGIEGVVDNLNAGGGCAVIDEKTGIITTDAMTKGMRFFETHPVTGFRFRGAQLPMWQEAVNMVLEAAEICGEVRYVAWDVALTEDKGPLVIEANYHPGYDLLQLADQVGKKDKLLEYI